MTEAADDDRFMQLVEWARERRPAERRRWVEAQCGADGNLAQQVLEYLAWDDKMHGFLAEPVILRHRPVADAFARDAVVAERYKIVREVGRGRSSVVFEALDLEAERRVALRRGGSNVFPPAGPGLPEVFGSGEVETAEGSVRFAAMEFLDGPVLAAHMASPDEVAAIVVRVCQTLIAAREAGFSTVALSERGVIVTEQGPVVTENWQGATGVQFEAADVVSIGIILRARMGRGSAWMAIAEGCLCGRYSLRTLMAELEAGVQGTSLKF